jgi:hypothetical protein
MCSEHADKTDNRTLPRHTGLHWMHNQRPQFVVRADIGRTSVAGPPECRPRTHDQCPQRRRPRLLASLRLHYGILVIVIVFILLATANNLLVPPFEGPDEPMHYAYVQHLAQGYGLPSEDVPDVYSGSYRPLQETFQLPLYYSLAALATAWIPGADNAQAAMHRNPYYATEVPNSWPDNENFWLRSPRVGAMDPGFVLGVRLARVVSTCLGVVAVLSAYGLGLICFDGDREKATWSAAWVAFNPEFVHISGVVNNDSTVAGLAALVLWIMAGWVIRGPSLGRAIAWGVALGLAALSKISVLGIIPVCALGFWLGARSERPRRAVRYAVIVVGLALLLSGWWYVRGFVLYGDPLGLTPHFTLSEWVDQEFSVLKQLSRLWYIDWSYWAAFGRSIVQPPEWLLEAVVWWGRIGLLGVGLYVWRSWRLLGRRRWLVALLLMWFCVYLVALLWWLWAFPLALGRLMFPAVAAIGVLLVMGWQGWLPWTHDQRPPRWQSVGLRVMTVGLLAFSVFSLLAVIRPSYVRPPQLSASKRAALDEWPHVIFEDGARLLAGEVNPRPVHPGEWTWVELCWESVAPLEEDYVVFVHFLGPDDRIVARRRTHAGLGTFPTSAWRPGDAFCDRINVLVDEGAPAPAVYDVEVGLYDGEREERLEARGEDGQIVAPVLVGRVKVWAAEPLTVAPSHVTDYRLDDEIALLGYDVHPAEVRAGEAFTLTLYWRAERQPKADYVAFVHLVDQAGNLVAQADGPPQFGMYPTSWWETGDELEDVREVVLPTDAGAGRYDLFVGLYQWETMERLPIYAADGTLVPDRAIRLTGVDVVR